MCLHSNTIATAWGSVHTACTGVEDCTTRWCYTITTLVWCDTIGLHIISADTITTLVWYNTIGLHIISAVHYYYFIVCISTSSSIQFSIGLYQKYSTYKTVALKNTVRPDRSQCVPPFCAVECSCKDSVFPPYWADSRYNRIHDVTH